MLSVLGIGAFYVIVSWSAVVGTGPDDAVALAQDPATAAQIFFGPVEQNIGHWAVIVFEFLLMTGSYACGMAFHNCASRYIYAIGRENLVPGFGRTLGATHPVHGSPYIAGFVQTAVASLIVLFFFVTDRDPDRPGPGRLRLHCLLPCARKAPRDRALVPDLRRTTHRWRRDALRDRASC
jgi:amino acid transporter